MRWSERGTANRAPNHALHPTGTVASWAPEGERSRYAVLRASLVALVRTI